MTDEERRDLEALLGVDDSRPGFLCGNCGALVLRNMDDEYEHPEPVCEAWAQLEALREPPKRDTDPCPSE